MATLRAGPLFNGHSLKLATLPGYRVLARGNRRGSSLRFAKLQEEAFALGPDSISSQNLGLS